MEKKNYYFKKNSGLNHNYEFLEIPNFLNEDLEYFREPKVIINNEKLMINFFKKKNNSTNKMPYLSRSRNDLIIYDYKKLDNIGSNRILKNFNSNNYLEKYKKMSEKRKILLKKFHFNYKKNNLSSCPTSFINQNKNGYYLPSIKDYSRKRIIKINNKRNYLIPKDENKFYNH